MTEITDINTVASWRERNMKRMNKEKMPLWKVSGTIKFTFRENTIKESFAYGVIPYGSINCIVI